MINNKYRIGNFTSSGIGALMSKDKTGIGLGKPALTYIREKIMERKLGRSLGSEKVAKPLTWGKLLEPRAFGLMGIEYELVSLETIVHPLFTFWAGSPDGRKVKPVKTVYDIKCPVTLKSFCQLVDPIYQGLTGMDAMNVIRKTHDSGEDYYWQLVSNAILTESTHAELVVYVPYFSELDEIRLMASNVPTEHLSKHYWIAMGTDDELTYILEGGYYKNINQIEFEVSQEDKAALTSRVLEAGRMLAEQETPKVIELSTVEPPVTTDITSLLTKIK